MTKEMERFTLRLPKALKSTLERQSEQMGVSLNALVIWALQKWANDRKSTPPAPHNKSA